MKNIIGDPVTTSNFYDREAEVPAMWTKLSRGHVILSAPRRAGKTSLMLKLQAEPRPSWRVVLFSAESHRTPAHFVASMIAAAREGLGLDDSFWKALSFYRKLKKLSGRVKRIDLKVLALDLEPELKDEWKNDGAEFVSALSRLDEKVPLIVDEFPIFVDRLSREPGEGRVQVEDMLHWFRALRQSGAGQTNPPRFLLGGSVGLDAVLGRLGLSQVVNDMEVMRLGGFARETAAAFLRELSKGEQLPLDGQTLDRVLDRLGVFVPFQLQLMFSRLVDAKILRKTEPSPETVDAAYNELLTSAYKKYFAHWDERLDRVLEQKFAEAARKVLANVARNTQGMNADEFLAAARARLPEVPQRELTAMLDLLTNDGYLDLANEDGGRQRLFFGSALLRDWWLHWHGGDEIAKGDR